jgi:UDP-glucose 4-epimerase
LGQYLHHAGHQIVLGSRNARSAASRPPYVDVVKTDWNDSRALEKICSGVDVVIHAAGINAQDCAADPVGALEFNGLATARLIRSASLVGVKRFIYLSTAHVYACPLIGNISEDACPRNLHPYATSHLAGENAVLSASQRGKIEGIVLRLSNAFGAPVHKDVNCWMLLVNDLCRQAVETGKMVLHSSGLQQRDFIAMTEVCHVVEHLSSRDFDAMVPRVFNVGSGVSHSVLEMAQLVQQRCNLIFGFEPELQRPETGSDEEHDMLMYRLDRLEKMGVNVCIDNSIEIDSLLAFCQASYNQNWSVSV